MSIPSGREIHKERIDTRVRVVASLTERCFAVVALIMLSPVFVVIAVMLKLETSGPVFEGGVTSDRIAFQFRCTLTRRGITSLTPVGQMLQRSGLDQLPLLINVVRGDSPLRMAYQLSQSRQAESRDREIPVCAISDVDWIDANVTSVGSLFFWRSKRFFDIAASLTLLPLLAFFSLVLLALNPIWNCGPLFFVQARMGKDQKVFRAIKFRSMIETGQIERGPDDVVEAHRITRLGKILRKARVDELPQILNVLRGQMSLIGPRPDYYPHALSYVENVPGYGARHIVRPGISGLAQVHLGYVEGTDATRKKVNFDHCYIQNAGFGREILLVLRTIVAVLLRAGS